MQVTLSAASNPQARFVTLADLTSRTIEVGRPESVVHVWSLKATDGIAVAVSPVLCDAELDRAVRFKKSEDRTEYVAARGSLRYLAALYLQREPDTIDIRTSDKGKPFIPESHLEFNVAHSNGQIIIAFTCGAEVGVDIERVDADVIDDSLLSFCLHRGEIEEYRSIPPELRAAYFFNRWAAKEAYLKLLGDGLAVEPATIDLRSTAILEGNVVLTPLSAPAAYFAALATYGGRAVASYEIG